jgi:8-amino-7-oxononanoate synthase
MTMRQTPLPAGDTFLAWLASQAAQRDLAGLTRTPPVRFLAHPADQDHPELIDLAGNDYLGLSQDPRVTRAAADAALRWGAGAGASRLVTGNLALHTDLEQALAEFCGQPAGLVFSSGYLANLGVVTALVGRGDLVICDAHAHASLMDACRLSRARVVTVEHLDVEAVSDLLASRPERHALVITESLFSVLGDAAPITDLAEACECNAAVLLVDEAHGIGVAGPDGRGLVYGTGLADQPNVLVTATLSKALGSQGGVVLGPAPLREHLLNQARSFGYDTGLAPAAAAAALTALEVLRDQPELVSKLHGVGRRLAEALGKSPAPGAVLPIPMPGPQQALAVRDSCARQGLAVGCFRPPSVPDRISRIRITAKASLTPEQLLQAEQILHTALTEVCD